MPTSPAYVLSRRRFVLGTAAMTGLAVFAGCGTLPDPGEREALLDLVEAARRDTLEFAAADTSHGGHADALRRLAEVRRTHATRLEEYLTTPDPAEDATGAPAAERRETTCPPVDAVRTRLREDAARAATTAVDTDGPAAQLAAAVSAACTAAAEVALA